MKIVFKTKPDFIKENFHHLEVVLLGRKEKVRVRPNIQILPNNVLQLDLGNGVEKALIQEKGKEEENLTKKKKKLKSRVFQAFLTFVMTMSLAMSVLIWGPGLYYSLFPVNNAAQAKPREAMIGSGRVEDKDEEEKNDAEKEQEDQSIGEDNKEVLERYLPDKSEGLPAGDWLVISRIGVNSRLQRTESEKEALDTGLWWVPDFGQPGDLLQPMIVAGHRYGWDWWWKNEYWKYHSFNKLPQLEPGDIVTVISEQRQWTYEIYAGEEGERISDYNADLILYTCKHLKSPVRIFRYAKLILPEEIENSLDKNT